MKNYINHSDDDDKITVSIYLFEITEDGLKNQLDDYKGDSLMVEYQCYEEKSKFVGTAYVATPILELVKISTDKTELAFDFPIKYKIALGSIKFFTQKEELNKFTKIKLEFIFENENKCSAQVKIRRIEN